MWPGSVEVLRVPELRSSGLLAALKSPAMITLAGGVPALGGWALVRMLLQ